MDRLLYSFRMAMVSDKHAAQSIAVGKGVSYPPQKALEQTEWNIICRMNWC